MKHPVLQVWNVAKPRLKLEKATFPWFAVWLVLGLMGVLRKPGWWLFVWLKGEQGIGLVWFAKHKLTKWLSG